MSDLLQVYKNILLVDDDPDDRDLFAEAVTIIDPTINITIKRDGEELMDCLRTISAKFDLIFLDLNMPRKNGKECLTEIKANEVHANTPIIIYTTSLNPVDIEETYTQGASFFLRKPNSFEELKDILAVLLRRKVLAREKGRETFVVNGAFNVA